MSSKERIYYEFDLENIEEIGIGSQLNFEHAKKDLEDLLGTYKSNVKIYRSEIPYKNFSRKTVY